MVILIRTFTN